MKAPRLVIGIDPGAETGFVALELRDFPSLDQAIVRSVQTIRASRAHFVEGPERDATLCTKIADAISDAIVESSMDVHDVVVVFEEPGDASARFKGSGGRGGGIARGSHFRLGVAYGLAVAGWHIARKVQGMNWTAASYPPTTRRTRSIKQPRIGWMDNGGRIPKHEHTAEMLNVLARTFHGDRDAEKWSDHTLMALGVLRYHLAQLGGR